MAFKGESKTSSAGRASYFARRKSALTAQRNKRLALERHKRSVAKREQQLVVRHQHAQAQGQAVCPMPGRQRALTRLANGRTEAADVLRVMHRFDIDEQEIRMHKQYLANRDSAVLAIAGGGYADSPQEEARLRNQYKITDTDLVAAYQKLRAKPAKQQ